mmetsp:Transcript_38783/g.99543  ORF Transcript_38783/g.99543 Transcript_38783/m.99543 type:complete len:96 (-) Transcript_38783:213-500(-)
MTMNLITRSVLGHLEVHILLLVPLQVDVVGPRRKRIAQAAGVSVGDVKELLKRYKAAERMHKLIRKRKAEGLPLPANADEAADMMMQSVSVSRQR